MATRVSSGPVFGWIMDPPVVWAKQFGRAVAPSGTGRGARGHRWAFLDSCRSCRQRATAILGRRGRLWAGPEVARTSALQDREVGPKLARKWRQYLPEKPRPIGRRSV